MFRTLRATSKQTETVIKAISVVYEIKFLSFVLFDDRCVLLLKALA